MSPSLINNGTLVSATVSSWAFFVAVVAVFVQYQDNVAYQKLDVPPIVNTVETIPVDVYKLEKVIVEYRYG